MSVLPWSFPVLPAINPGLHGPMKGFYNQAVFALPTAWVSTCDAFSAFRFLPEQADPLRYWIFIVEAEQGWL